MSKVVIYRSLPPTRRQLNYIEGLVQRMGVERPQPRTRAEASEYISQLERRRRHPFRRGYRRTGSPRRPLRRLLRALFGLPPEARPHFGREERA